MNSFSWRLAVGFKPFLSNDCSVLPMSFKYVSNTSKFNTCLEKAFMFKMLTDSEKSIVIDAMKEKCYQKDDYVIKQGDDGDELFLVESGLLKCYKKFSKGAEDTYLLDYKHGMAFGE